MPIGDSHEPISIWKKQDEEEGAVPIKTAPDDFAERVRSMERQNRFVAWSALIIASAIAIGALHNVYVAEQPWIRLSQAWMVAVISYIFATESQRRGVKGSDEPCARFLERRHEEQARSYLRFRRIVPLMIPGIVAAWLGGGPLITAKSSWFFRFCAGPGPFVMIGVALAFLWWAFGTAAKKAYRDRDEIRHRIAE
ncbi:MAG TPA: hypothetical protein VGL53_08695 [Bryobacteraceae bacterium]|jgi:membrane protein implicated in regulation of membrane protease activity